MRAPELAICVVCGRTKHVHDTQLLDHNFQGGVIKDQKRKEPCSNCKKKGRPDKPPIRAR